MPIDSVIRRDVRKNNAEERAVGYVTRNGLRTSDMLESNSSLNTVKSRLFISFSM